MMTDGTLRVQMSADGHCALLSGTLQLAAVTDYEAVFAPISAALEQAESTFTIDVSGIVFMNSSAVTALARIVLAARRRGVAIALKGSVSHYWQHATLRTLGRLYNGATVDLS